MMSSDLENFVEELRAVHDDRGPIYQVAWERYVNSTAVALCEAEKMADLDGITLEKFDELRAIVRRKQSPRERLEACWDVLNAIQASLDERYPNRPRRLT